MDEPFAMSCLKAVPVLCFAFAAHFSGWAADPAIPESTRPEAPLGVAMTANSADSITLSWYRAPKDDATTYNVYASAGKEGPFQKIATVNERSAVHRQLAPDTRHFYKVAAVNDQGEGELSAVAEGFTIKPAPETPFPVRLARNMCVSLDAPLLCDRKPLQGTLANLVDGSDATGCRLRKDFEVKIPLNPDRSIQDAEYLIVHFRTDCGPQEWSNDKNSRTLKKYVILESLDSTDGQDGTWTEVASGTNALLDGVIVIPNHQPKWIALRSDYGPTEEVPSPEDTRLKPSDLILCRLDIFRSAPEGCRNDYWIFTGDSLVVGDMPGGANKERSAWFSDLVRQQHPDRYPIVVHLARGGQMMKDTLPMLEKALPDLSPKNGTDTPTATIVGWEPGYNDVGVQASPGTAARVRDKLEEARALCDVNGLIMIPVRIEYSTEYLNLETLEPKKYNVFVNSLAVNLHGVDVFCRESTPYACDPKTQLPYADYWTYTRKNYATALVQDGVHHTNQGKDGINRLWADVADRMIYAPQK
jgi:hypothetical protein